MSLWRQFLVPLEEASRFGVVITDEDKRIREFEEKPAHPRSNLASMGIYIFNWSVLKGHWLHCQNSQAVTLESLHNPILPFKG